MDFSSVFSSTGAYPGLCTRSSLLRRNINYYAPMVLKMKKQKIIPHWLYSDFRGLTSNYYNKRMCGIYTFEQNFQQKDCHLGCGQCRTLSDDISWASRAKKGVVEILRALWSIGLLVATYNIPFNVAYLGIHNRDNDITPVYCRLYYFTFSFPAVTSCACATFGYALAFLDRYFMPSGRQ
ncbi:uncharacterized protein LOC112574526 [Pomacea canaliculata]|uniref:uncharacterized protein LOC112574526 n=1 Tax=Pomacea canaliculata TaxID=400727 RepID=UPI000D73D9AF|nr:uncharacterized protein LOC112574526 [Pomacea canaliculata]XP_025111452.1 uncharacterized protein LOC112574526 [Pomacea canaliculata]